MSHTDALPLLERILVPVDGSPAADAASSMLGRIPAQEGPELVLARVVNRRSLRKVAEREGELHDAIAHVTGLEDRLREAGWRAKHLLCAGDPGEQLLALVDLLRPSLVAMTAVGAGETASARGRVAEMLLQRCPVPLLVGTRQALPLVPGAGFARILVPLDGSELSARALGPVAALARAQRSEVVLLHVDVDWGDASRWERLLDPWRRELLSRGVERVRIRTAAGEPAPAILEVARAEGADLLAMTSHGHPDPSRRWFGSTAEAVLRHAGCPLLVVRVPSASLAPTIRK